jgi:hypothetical protein
LEHDERAGETEERSLGMESQSLLQNERYCSKIKPSPKRKSSTKKQIFVTPGQKTDIEKAALLRQKNLLTSTMQMLLCNGVENATKVSEQELTRNTLKTLLEEEYAEILEHENIPPEVERIKGTLTAPLGESFNENTETVDKQLNTLFEPENIWTEDSVVTNPQPGASRRLYEQPENDLYGTLQMNKYTPPQEQSLYTESMGATNQHYELSTELERRRLLEEREEERGNKIIGQLNVMAGQIAALASFLK